MTASIRPLLLVALLLTLTGCGSNLVKWVPVDDGLDAGGDHVITRDDVVVTVTDFGVRDGWGKPAAELRVANKGSRTVRFDLADTRLDVEGELIPPTLDPGKPSAVTLPPEGQFATQLVFATTLPIQPRTDEGSQDMLVVTRELHLHLPALAIDGQEAALPVLIYRNPDPLQR